MFCSNQRKTVDNCTDFCLDLTDGIFAAKSTYCHDPTEHEPDSKCECLRPYFPKNGECVTALQITRFEWVVPFLVIFALWDLYNIFYAIWILRLKGPRCTKEQGCKCQMNLVAYGAVFAIVMLISRLLRNTDPYYYRESVHDRWGYVFTDMSWAMTLLTLCCVFLSFNKAVQSQSRDDTADRRNCAKRTVIATTAVGVTGYLSRDIVVLIFRAADRAHFETPIYTVYNSIAFVVFITLFVLMTIEARTLHTRLINFSKTFQNARTKAEKAALARIGDLVTVLKRYLYPMVGCGYCIMAVLLTYNVCLADLSPSSYIFSWIMIDFLVCANCTVMLLVLESSPVTAFPRHVVTFFRLRCCPQKNQTTGLPRRDSLQEISQDEQL